MQAYTCQPQDTPQCGKLLTEDGPNHNHRAIMNATNYTARFYYWFTR